MNVAEAIAAERQRGMGQYAVAIGPQPDRLGMLRKKAQEERLKLSSQIAFNTKFELALATQLVGKDKERNLIQEKIKDLEESTDSSELLAKKDKKLKELDDQVQQLSSDLRNTIKERDRTWIEKDEEIEKLQEELKTSVQFWKGNDEKMSNLEKVRMQLRRYYFP